MKLGINGATTMPYSLEEDIISAGECGFSSVELWYGKVKDYLNHHSLEELKSLIISSKLEVASLCPTFIKAFSQNSEALSEIEIAAQIAQGLNCSTILACPDTPPEGMSKKEAISIFARVAREAADITEKYGVRIALEPLGMHPLLDGPESAMEVIKIANKENLGLMIDTFHYYKSGVPIEHIAQIPIEKLYIIHINDCDNLPLEELQDKDRTYPTLGVIPAVEMLTPFMEKGYNGTVSVEIFRPEYWKMPINIICEKARETGQELLNQIKGVVK